MLKDGANINLTAKEKMNIKDIRTALKDLLFISKQADNVFSTELATQDRGEYSQILIEYVGHEKDLIRAYLLLPKGEGPFPAVLIHHQHNSEWHLGKSEVCGMMGDPLNAFGSALAKSGFIVLSPDSIGFEDRRISQKGNERNEKGDWLQYFNGMAYRMVSGRLLMTTVLCDARIGISLLTAHRKVDKTRIGILGHSYGGSTSIFHAAIDERVKFVCASGAACSYKNKIENETGIEMSLIIPGILKQFDIPDIVKCINPRNTLLVSATDDIYSKDTTDIVNKVHQELTKQNEIDKLEHKQYKGNHTLTEERFDSIIDWIKKQGQNKHEN